MVTFGGVTLDIGLDERRAAALRNTRVYRAASRVMRRGRHGRDAGMDSTAPPGLRASDYASTEARALAERVNALRWYHSIDLPQGVTTPGLTDHRRQMALYGLPDDMRGMRALDIATFDGFWAFEFERRGAEVVALDIASIHDADIPLRIREGLDPDDNRPTGDGFRLAHESLGSRVERRECSVYDLTPEAVGTFDVVFMSDLLLHLRDPQRALERAYSVVKDDGYAMIAEPHNPELSVLAMPVRQLVAYDRYVWGLPSAELLKRMLKVAGFGDIEEISRFQLEYRGSFPLEKIVVRAYPWQRRLAASTNRGVAGVSAR